MTAARRLVALVLAYLFLAVSFLPSRADQSSLVVPTTGPMNMTTFVGSYLNPAILALGTCNSGASSPTNGPSSSAFAQQCWWDTSGTPWTFKVYDGSAWVSAFTINASTHVFTVAQSQPYAAKAGATYTVGDSDRGSFLKFTNSSSVAVALPQAGVAGAFSSGWYVDLIYTGSGSLTVTPTTSTINGSSSLVLVTSQGVRIISDGTNYQLIERAGFTSPNFNGSGSVVGNFTVGAGLILNGSVGGSTTIQAASTASGILTAPATTDTLAVLGPQTFSNTQRINPPFNVRALYVNQYGNNGSDTTPGVEVLGIWNTSGSPTAILLNMTNTTSGASSKLLDLQVGSVSQFNVAKDGSTVITGNFTASGFLTSGAATYHNWAGRSQMLSASDGLIRMTNNADSGFSGLILGLADATGIRLKKTSTTLFVRLGDDSGDASFNTGNITVGTIASSNITSSGFVTSGASTYHNWAGRAQMLSPSDGNITLADNAGTAFTCLAFGGTTTAYGAICRSGTTLKFRLGDNSADGPMSASTGTFSTSVTIGAGSAITSSGAGGALGTGAFAAAGITALTTDVTATGPGSVAATIAANAVTYAKFQQVAASSLVGNATGSLANATGITIGATFAFSGSALQTAAITGDVTASANSFATTLATSQGAVHTWGATQTFNPASNTRAIYVNQAALSGTDATSSIEINTLWNTSGTPTTFKMVTTDTASNAASLFMDLRDASASQFSVSKVGAVSANGFITSSTNRGFIIASKLVITSTADGTALIQNTAQTDFTCLQLALTTTSAPALCRSSTAVKIRLADNSADAPLTSSTFTASTSVTIGAGSAITSSGAGGAIGTAAFVNTGTSGATIPLLNGSNTFSSETVASVTSGANGFTVKNSSLSGTKQWTFSPTTNGTDTDLDMYEYATSGSGYRTKFKAGGGITLTAGQLNVAAMTNAATTSAVCYNTGTGAVTYDGTIGTCTVSDERLKNIQGRIAGALDKLLMISGVYYTWKDETLGSGLQIGVGAQTVERVFPELVQTDSNGRKSADYQRLVAPIIEAIRELKADNDNRWADFEKAKASGR